jgi:hypothetical protein
MTTTGLAICCRTFCVPRRGHPAEECEDAVATDPARGRFAIADGAAESAESGLWARLLVETFVHTPPEQPWPDWLTPPRQQWTDAVRRPSEAEPLPWFLEGRYRDGAYATFLGLVLDGPRWFSLAVGDSCLFQVRGERLVAAFPLEHSSQFDNNPWLVGSRAGHDEAASRHSRQMTGECLSGDRLYLMTDALARWFLLAIETGARPWLPLETLLAQPDDAFTDWVGRLRADRQLRNDDTTLVSIRL